LDRFLIGDYQAERKHQRLKDYLDIFEESARKKVNERSEEKRLAIKKYTFKLTHFY